MRRRGVALIVGLLLASAVSWAGGASAQVGGAVDRAPATSPSPSTITSTSTSTTTSTASAAVRTVVGAATLSVGEVAKLRLEVEAPASVEVALPEQSFGGLELVDRRVSTSVQNGRSLTVYELDLLALEPGDVEIPALTVKTVGANGELGSVKSEPKKLHVASLIANEPNAEPKGATKPLSVMRDDYTLAYVAGGLMLIALIAFLTLRISRYLKQRPKPVAPAPPPRPAWELAFEKLHALAARKDELFAQNKGEEYIDGVSDALREYLGRRYGFDGLERTTGELLSTLEALRPHKLSLSGVALLLEQCDLVKFARATPDAEQCQDLWNGAIGLIRATTPTPSVTPAAAPTTLPTELR